MRNASVFIVWEIKIEKKKYTTKVGRQSSGRRRRQSPACVEGRLGGESKPKRRGGCFLSSPHCSVHFPWALCFVVPPSFLTPSSGSSHPPVAHLPKALQCLLFGSWTFSIILLCDLERSIKSAWTWWQLSSSGTVFASLHLINCSSCLSA